MNYGLLIDVILIALFVGCVYLCARSGLIKTVATLLAVVVAVGSAYFIAQRLSPYVARAVVNPLIERTLERSFEKHMTEDTLGALDSAMDTVDGLIAKIKEKFFTDEENQEAAAGEPEEEEKESLFSDTETVARKITDIVGGALTAVLLFFLFYALILAVLRVLIDSLSFLGRMPIIGPVNTLLGLILGIFAGYALIAFPIWAVCRLVPSVLGDVQLFSPETLEKSRVVAFVIGRLG